MRRRKLQSALVAMLLVSGSVYAAPEATVDGVPFTPSIAMNGDAKIIITDNGTGSSISGREWSMDNQSTITVSNGGRLNFYQMYDTPGIMTDNAAITVAGVGSVLDFRSHSPNQGKFIRDSASITITDGARGDLFERILLEKSGSIVGEGQSDLGLYNVKVSGDDAKIIVKNGKLQSHGDTYGDSVDYGTQVLDSAQFTVKDSSSSVSLMGTYKDRATVTVKDSSSSVILKGTYKDRATVTVSNVNGDNYYLSINSNVSDDGSIKIDNLHSNSWGNGSELNFTIKDKGSLVINDAEIVSATGTISDNASMILRDTTTYRAANVQLSGNATLEVVNDGAAYFDNTIVADSGTVTVANKDNNNNSLKINGVTAIENSDGAHILFNENAATVSTIGETINSTINNAENSQIVYNGLFNTGASKGLDVIVRDSSHAQLNVGNIKVSGDNTATTANEIAVDGTSNITADVGDITFNGGDNAITWDGDATGDYTVENVQINGQNNNMINSNVKNVVVTGDRNEFDTAVLDGAIITGNENVVKDGTLDNARISGDKNTLLGENSAVIVAGSNNNLIDAENSYVSGYDNEITGNNIVAIGNNIKKTTSNSVFIGNESAYNDNANQSAGNGTTNKSSMIGNMTFNNTAGVDTNVGVVSFGKEDQTRVMQGVSAGLVGLHSTDAINGSQLYATNTAIANIGSSMTNIIGGNAHMDSSGNIMVSNVGGTGQDTVDGAIRSNKERIDALESVNTNAREEAKSVGALSAALAGLHPMQYDPKKPSQIMAAVGQYDSKRAVALGVAHYVNEDLLLTTGMSMQGSSHNKNMVNLGVTYKFGKGRGDVRKEYAAGPISSIYVMQDKIDALEQKNQQLEEANAHFMERTRELEEKVNALLAKVS